MSERGGRGNFSNRPELNPGGEVQPRCASCHCLDTPSGKKVCIHCGRPFDALLSMFFNRERHGGNIRMLLWNTAARGYTHIDDMDSDHLLNCIKLMVQRGWETRAVVLSQVVPAGKRASRLKKRDAELYAAILRSTWIEYMTPVFYTMLVTLQARGSNFGLNECHRYFDKEVRCSSENSV